MDRIDAELKKAVKEYFEWHGDKHGKPVKFLENKDGMILLLARFTDGTDGEETSCFMTATKWADGHWDVTETATFYRACEDANVEEFVSNGNEIFYDDDYDEDDDDDFE